MIFAIDPGPEVSAVVHWDGTRILGHRTPNNDDLLSQIEGLPPSTTVAIEMIASYGMPVGREVFDTCFWIGRFFEAANGCLRAVPQRIYRSAIKLHHCNSMQAKDSNIIQALKDKYGDKGTKKDPGTTYGLKGGEWQAFALATYVTETRK